MDLFGNEIEEPKKPETEPTGTVWKGRVPMAVKKEAKTEDFSCLTHPRGYEVIRQSKTQIWILNK